MKKYTVIKWMYAMSKNILYGLIVQLVLVNLLLATGFSNGQDNELLQHQNRYKSLKDIELQKMPSSLIIEEAFDLIQQETGFTFSYLKGNVPLQKRIKISAQNKNLYDHLMSISRQAELSFRRINNKIVVKTKQGASEKAILESFAMQQQKSISGKVNDAETGEPIAGVNVVVSGSSIGTITDVDGAYTLEVPETAEALTFSYVGYEAQEVETGDRSVINVILAVDLASLNEVVVIGYGTRSKNEVTTAIASVNSEQIKDQVVSGFDQAVAGMLPGVQLAQTSGAPGANGEFRIRGIGTLTAGIEPLIVVDGVPLMEGLNFSQLNPADIASIDVLKDASAAAIYGSRGANGVIIITTKKGSFNQPLSIQFNAFGGIQQISQKIDLMDAYEMADYIAASRNNAWINLDPNNNSAGDPNDVRSGRYQIPDYVQPYLQGTPGLTNTDWQDEVFRSVPMQNYQISAGGGSESIRYYVSGNYFDQQGIIENTDFTRYSVKANVDALLNDNINFSLNLNPTFSSSQLTNPGGHWQNGVVIGTFFAQPFFSPYNQDGSLDLTSMLGAVIEDQQFRRSVQNPLAIARMEDRVQENFRLIGSFNAQIDLWPGLTFNTNFGVDYADSELSFFRPAGLGFYNNLPPAVSEGSLSNDKSISWLSENTLSFQKTFGQRHNLSFLAGYTYQQADFSFSQIAANNFPNDNITTLNAGNIIVDNTFSRESAWTLISYLGRLSYDFANKYYFTASIRRDGSSRFGDDSKWGIFPSFSGAWRISQESFLQNQNLFSELKLRASWGQSGNNQIGDFASKSLLRSTNYILGNELVNGLSPATLPNNVLTWETTEMINVGLDVSFWDDLIYLNLDYFVANTNDLLLNVPIPASAGYTNSISNFGEVKNQGFELMIGSRTTIGDLQWDGAINFSTIRNEVVALGPDQDQLIDGGVFITKVGEPVSSYFGYVVDGVFTSENQLESTPHHPAAKVGSYIYRDINGDEMITSDDRQIIGNPWPDFTFGFNSRFQYRNFDLSFQLQGVQGYDVYLNNAFTYFNHEAWTNMHRDLLAGVNDPQNSSYAWPNIDPGESLWQSSTQKFADASFVRLRNLTLGYTIPEAFTDFAPIRIYGSAQNLFTITDYPGYNPEVDDEATTLQIGKAWSEYPLPKSYVLGINLTF